MSYTSICKTGNGDPPPKKPPTERTPVRDPSEPMPVQSPADAD